MINYPSKLVIEVPVSNQESEQSCSYVLKVSLWVPSAIFLLNVATALTLFMFLIIKIKLLYHWMIMLECAFNNKTIYTNRNSLIYLKVLRLFKSKLNMVFVCKRDQPLIGLWNNCRGLKKSLKIPKGQSESVYRRRTDDTMVKRKRTKGQTTIYTTYI
jgi:hypothetical protein